MAVLLILTGKHQGKRLSIPEGEVLIGRDITCQIRLATEEVSRQHCRLRCEDDEVFVTDLGSRNGTIINDQTIQAETAVHPGDVLRIGPISFQLLGKRVVESPPTRSPSDDSILDWLSEGETPSVTDSTVIPREVAAKKTAAPPKSAPLHASTVEISRPATPMPPTKKFESVGEEGEDIIQRHYDLVQTGKIPKRVPALKKK